MALTHKPQVFGSDHDPDFETDSEAEAIGFDKAWDAKRQIDQYVDDDPEIKTDRGRLAAVRRLFKWTVHLETLRAHEQIMQRESSPDCAEPLSDALDRVGGDSGDRFPLNAVAETKDGAGALDAL